MKLLRRQDIEYRQLRSGKTGEEFSRSAVLSAALESKDFFIHHEILAPGRRASAPHFHRETEEFIYVLRGHVTATEGDEECELAPGESAIFSANAETPHFVENRSHEDVEFLVVSRNLSSSDVHYGAEKRG